MLTTRQNRQTCHLGRATLSLVWSDKCLQNTFELRIAELEIR